MKIVHFLIVFLILIACSKNKKMCKESQDNPPFIEAPAEVYERESIKISIKNVEGRGYFAKFPDMSFLNYQPAAGTENKEWLIKSALAKNEGTYTFTFQDNICGDLNLSKSVKVKPLPCPCFSDVAENSMVVKDSATGVESTIACNVDLLSFDGELSLAFDDPQFEYNLKLKFNDLPEKSSTYYLKNYYENSDDTTIPDDDERQAYVVLIRSSSTVYEYRLDPLSEDIYFKREGNHIILTLCGVRFKSNADVLYVSAKMVLDI